MTKYKTIKEKITEAVLAEIDKKDNIYLVCPIDKVMFKWFITGRQEGLRLTDEGVNAFKLANIEFYDHEFKQEGQSYYSFILELNKKIKCPFYIGTKKIDGKKTTLYIRLYDSKIAMVLNLYGNLKDYLNSVKEKKR